MPRSIVALCAIALVGVIAGCGGPDESDQSGDSQSGEYGSVEELATAMRDASLAHESAALTIAMDGAPVGTGAIRVGEEQVDLSMTWEQNGEDRGTIRLGGVSFVDVGPEAAPGKPWARVDPEAGTEVGATATVISFAATQSVNSTDPVSALAEQASAAQIVNTATEEINGVQARRYDIEVDLISLAENAEAAEAAVYAMSIQAGKDTISSTMWTDESGLPVRYESQMTAPDGVVTTTAVDYAAWGEPVEIAEPSADEVAEAADVEALAGPTAPQ